MVGNMLKRGCKNFLSGCLICFTFSSTIYVNVYLSLHIIWNSKQFTVVLKNKLQIIKQ